MAVECAVISGIFLLMSVIFWRRHRIQWVWATLPLMLVPLSYFVTISVISHLMDIDVNVLAVVVVLIAAVGISCVWLGFVSNGFKSKKTRVSYITIANLFNIALALILSVNRTSARPGKRHPARLNA